MRASFIIFFCFVTVCCQVQKDLWTRISINPALHIDTSFRKNWSYQWYIVKDDNGHFENTLIDSITSEDTAHQYYTAACTNTLLGLHHIYYCKASLYNDDVELHFSGQPPGYNEQIIITIRNNFFKVECYFQSVVVPAQETTKSYEVLSQKLVLKRHPIYDHPITGMVEIRYREKTEQQQISTTKKARSAPAVTYSKVYLFKGRFQTPLNDVIEIE